MNIEEIIKTRRSVRVFKDQLIDKKLITTLIEAAANAPSACNIQGWKFIIVDDQKIKDLLYEYGGSVIIKNSPIGILILYDKRTLNHEYHDDVQSAAAAIQNINLMATELNLGTCWVCHLPPKKILRKIFKIPSYYSPIAYLLLGYPKQNLLPVARKYTLEQIMSYNIFSEKWPIEKNSSYKIIFKLILIKFYYITPQFVKKIFLNKFLDKYFVKKFKN